MLRKANLRAATRKPPAAFAWAGAHEIRQARRRGAAPKRTSVRAVRPDAPA